MLTSGYQDDLGWRLDAIYRVLDLLPMWAAAWPSLSALERADVRVQWGSVTIQLDHFAWHWHRYAAVGTVPLWWGRLRRALRMHLRLIEYLELPLPQVARITELVRTNACLSERVTCDGRDLPRAIVRPSCNR